ncbi:hypothetical protein SAMN05443529_104235 [Desulfosporosinus hippei DSM 8344]|uniref:Uncharacterized protein n=1 Tax=Desulfosporosinus hippei DSM 8344 TaxID=1121419 RepID=A0A1G7VVL3_9FIRM|nr:hypothetical protein SAMN05443529_104235 [Desulfosporosinus hippei DSM 8344]
MGFLRVLFSITGLEHMAVLKVRMSLLSSLAFVACKQKE